MNTVRLLLPCDFSSAYRIWQFGEKQQLVAKTDTGSNLECPVVKRVLIIVAVEINAKERPSANETNVVLEYYKSMSQIRIGSLIMK
jgi:hypothetical protein